jgi:hypothetical protein
MDAVPALMSDDDLVAEFRAIVAPDRKAQPDYNPDDDADLAAARRAQERADFVVDVIDVLGWLLHDSRDARARLDLLPGIVNGWRRYLATKSPAAMAALVEETCRDNKIDLTGYEARKAARAAAEMILATCDGVSRKLFTRPN